MTLETVPPLPVKSGYDGPGHSRTPLQPAARARATSSNWSANWAQRATNREELEAALARLTARGDLLELRPGHYTVTARSREFAIGRLNMHRDGYGFLISERPIEGIAGDVFIPPDSAANGPCMATA